MSTDPFSNINSGVQIGQSNYIELISIKSKTEIAILGPTPNVNDSLFALAYGKNIRKKSTPTTQSQIIATPQNFTPGIQKYSIKPQAVNRDSLNNLNSEFRALVSNAAFDAPTCSTGTINCPEPRTGCMLDIGIVLDNTSSMNTAIKRIKDDIAIIAGHFQTISGGNIRFGLLTFKDCDEIVSHVKFPTTGNCNNTTAFKAKLAAVTSGGGAAAPEAGDYALEKAVNGEAFGPWRDDQQVIKVIMFVTDAKVAGCNNAYDPEDVSRLYAAASAAGDCDIRIISAAVAPASVSPGIRVDMQQVAALSGGIYVETSSTGAGLLQLLLSYIFSLCNDRASDECAQTDDIIINGKFDANVAGWTQTASTVTWDSTKYAMKLSGGGGASQTVSGLTPGDLLLFAFDVDGGTTSSTLTYGFSGYPSSTDTINLTASQSRQRQSINLNVPDSGTVTVFFQSTGNLTIDNVKLCVFKTSDCGVGSANVVLNPQFESGVGSWTDAAGVAITPVDDPQWWNEGSESLLLTLAGKKEVRQQINGLTAGRIMTLSFDILSHEPDTIGELSVRYGVLTSTGTNITSKIIKNSDVTFPYRASESFVVPSNGSVIIYFKAGDLSGEISIDNVLVCNMTGTCQANYTKLSFSDFVSGRDGWSGGSYSATPPVITLGPSNILTRTYTGLTPGTTFQITFEVLDDGGVIVELVSGDTIGQFFSPLTKGPVTYTHTVQSSEVVQVNIQVATDSLRLSNILVCNSNQATCKASIKELKAMIKWKGVPRKPLNIFNLFARIVVRDPNNPYNKSTINLLPISDGHLGVVNSTSCLTGTYCDFWKQNGNGGLVESAVMQTGLTTLSAANISAGGFSSVTQRSNWLWSIPGNTATAGQDALVVIFPIAEIAEIVESVEILYLANYIEPSGSDTTPVCAGPFTCGPDPGTELEVVINYKNFASSIREFKQTIQKDDIYPQSVDFSTIAPNTWDTQTALSNGLKGVSARWESTKFVLDSTAGTGLDQCSAATGYNTDSGGTMLFKKMLLSGKGQFFAPCNAEVIVEETQKGVLVNEKQSIILPSPSGGSWDITVTIREISATATVIWNATASELETSIEGLNNVGAGNVSVTGSGTDDDPYIIEFVGELSGVNIPMITVDGSDLTGVSAAFITTITDGTTNERQTITPKVGTLSNFTVKFNSVSSATIPYNASLNQKQALIESISSIGAGNISVTGTTTDRTAAYTGVLILDFQGTLANTNVPTVVVTPNTDYKVKVNWHGSIGVNEKQKVSIEANGGTYILTVYDPENPEDSHTTDPIPYNATAEEVAEALTSGTAFLEITDVLVTKLDADPDNPDLIEWTVEFIGTKAGLQFEPMTIDGSGLLGGDATIEGISDGNKVFEKQKITIKRANAGHFKLVLTINGVTEQSQNIVWNTTEEGLHEILAAHSELEPEDIVVLENPPAEDPEITSRFTVTFKDFGDVELMKAVFINSLQCNPILLAPVDSPPYPYPLPTDIDEDLSCQFGPLLSRPGPGDVVDEIEPCCDAATIRESANISISLNIQRDLFDPNAKTTPTSGAPQRMSVRTLAKLKGHNPNDFTPYMRDQSTNALTEVDYSLEARTGISIVLLEKELDTATGRSRAINYLKNTSGILPSRMVWPRFSELTASN